MAGNRKSFSLSIRESKSFDIIMSYFDYAITFVFNIKPKINLSYVISALSKITQTITVKKIKVSISKTKLYVAITQTINAKKVKVTVLFAQLMKFVINPNLILNLTIVGVLRQKIVSVINLKKLVIDASATLATFYPLSTYDPQTLLTLDAKTLGEMDYTSS